MKQLKSCQMRPCCSFAHGFAPKDLRGQRKSSNSFILIILTFMGKKLS
uniref:Uncharacterized protein n=1 Tax=Manihot esculenta TaxID=3983 RepID=A0A2C9USA0_MANES